MNSGRPWVLSFSVGPSCISSKNVPPPWAGFPINDVKDLEAWESHRTETRNVFQDLFKDFNEWLLSNGSTELPIRWPPLNYSPYANIYMCPEEVDYTKYRPNPPNFYRFDSFLRSEEEDKFEIPVELKDKPGKLIYLSMGTIGCSDLGLMTRLTKILKKAPHRFIVSKGPLASKYDLPENMWGAPSVPQIKVLAAVDLVISHGGNNTVTESLYFGKPMIILPLFGDQPDNAQRIQEAGLGIRLNSHKVEEQDLLSAIETLLADRVLAEKLSKISARIQGARNQERAADVIEQVGIKGA